VVRYVKVQPGYGVTV